MVQGPRRVTNWITGGEYYGTWFRPRVWELDTNIRKLLLQTMRRRDEVVGFEIECYSRLKNNAEDM